jgi:hypothetical protein
MTMKRQDAVHDHMDHPRAVDPLDRPNWPHPAPP